MKTSCLFGTLMLMAVLSTGMGLRWTTGDILTASQNGNKDLHAYVKDHLDLEYKYHTLAAEKSTLLAEISALQMQISFYDLATEGQSLQNQLNEYIGGEGGGSGSDRTSSESEHEMEKRSSSSNDRKIVKNKVATNAIDCEQISIHPSSVCPEISAPASGENLRKCQQSICKKMDNWGIAQGSGSHITGEGYGCQVHLEEHTDAGEAVCVYPAGVTPPAPPPPVNKKYGGQQNSNSNFNMETVAKATPDDAKGWSREQLDEKKEFVKNMMKHAWEGYREHAWGNNELSPQSRKGISGGLFGKNMGATIVDSLDTLYMMGMSEELEEARQWIDQNLDFNADESVSVFEMVIRFLGGLLSAYALTHDEMYKNKAEDLAKKIMPAFDTNTGVPWGQINLATGQGSMNRWAPSGMAILSEMGTLQLEMEFLSDITNDNQYRDAATKTMNTILAEGKGSNGLFPNYFDPQNGEWGDAKTSMGPYGDSFYEYLLKIWIYNNGHNAKHSTVSYGKNMSAVREFYDETISAVREHMHQRASSTNSLYVADYEYNHHTSNMWHLACFSGGMYALSAATAPTEELAALYREDAADVTQTCRDMYKAQPTGLGPESVNFKQGGHEVQIKDSRYILRPETVESYFYLWRTTHDPKYRDWAWDVIQAIEQHCKCGAGYCGIADVTQERPSQDDVMQSFFLAETLKYLYLIFTEDSVLPLDDWVFNTEAHPIPVRNSPSWASHLQWSTVV